MIGIRFSAFGLKPHRINISPSSERELSESLEQQTATSDVLRVISSSPTDIQPVLETIGERAEKLCDAEIGLLSVVDGELIRLASIHGITGSRGGSGSARTRAESFG
jgi:hypothetical protein